MKYTNENGRSMVEMLGVLAIIGVLSVGGIAGYSKAMNKYKINKTTDQVSMLVANIRTIFSSQGDYEGLTNTQAKKFGVVPNDMYTNASNSTITNAFNGAVKIAAAGGRGSGDNEAFTITYDGLTQEACVTIVTGDWGSGQASGLIGIAAKNAAGADSLLEGTSGVYTTTANGSAGNGSIVGVPGGKGATAAASYATPVKVTNAVAACTGTGSSNSVAWKYY